MKSTQIIGGHSIFLIMFGLQEVYVLWRTKDTAISEAQAGSLAVTASLQERVEGFG